MSAVRRAIVRLTAALLAVSVIGAALWMCSVPACETPLEHLAGFGWIALGAPLCIGVLIEGLGKEKP